MNFIPKHPEPSQAERVHTLGTPQRTETIAKCGECGKVVALSGKLLTTFVCSECLQQLEE